ncbi:SURF1 family cytochrome oxidase biogenesis protein [Sphingobium boeckii]|uniref:SURF1-like protein n=1 Tax=Sphingobium boeckii TaxID=1082345 RepID=A0A7W9EE06_9SPHN|nr:SURF1 family protein [Sphingobium boeckii]MBB5684186.1 cytochrome oxidase assembly protein ShyY1 [Sphingobium boeckii]
MKRIPLIPTILVGLAMAIMIAMGVWQIQRKGEKEALLALYAANLRKPEMAFPAMAPVPDEAMFRRSAATCLEVTGWRIEGGRALSGGTGYRQIASCRTGAEGPGLLVDLGVTQDPAFKPSWTGGPVSGWIASEPEHGSLLGRLFSTPPVARALLISAAPAPGLEPTQPPGVGDIPNNHLAYAVQWFLFAGIAGIIYAIALKRRGGA